MRNSTVLLTTTAALLAMPAHAQGLPASAADAGEEGAIEVYGKGETRQVQELDNASPAILAPGTSPLKAIERLPSVNFFSPVP